MPEASCLPVPYVRWVAEKGLLTLYLVSDASYVFMFAPQVMSFPVDCVDCRAPGETRMCVTDVPHFKEIIIMSFLCDDCGYRTVEVKGGGAVPEHGTKTTLRVAPGENSIAVFCLSSGWEVCQPGYRWSEQ